MFGPGGSGSTMVDSLTPACRKLVDGIQDLLRYKEDAQITEAILPHIIKMLACKLYILVCTKSKKKEDFFAFISPVPFFKF